MTRTTAFLRYLGRIRDGLLVLLGLMYAAGFLVLNYNAWRNGLGVLPALDFQYFVAGFVPVALALAAVVASSMIKTLNYRLYIGFTKRPDLAAGLVSVLGQTTLLLSLGAGLGFGLMKLLLRGPILRWVTNYNEMLARNLPDWLANQLGIETTFEVDSWLWVVVGLLGFALLLLFPAAVSVAKPARAWRVRSLNYVAQQFPLAILALVVFFFYVTLAYPQLPLQLGGPMPDCAQLDIEKSKLSPQTLVQLAGTAAVSARSEVVRTKELDILFLAGNTLVVRPAKLASGGAASVFRMDRAAVRSIVWCP